MPKNPKKIGKLAKIPASSVKARNFDQNLAQNPELLARTNPNFEPNLVKFWLKFGSKFELVRSSPEILSRNLVQNSDFDRTSSNFWVKIRSKKWPKTPLAVVACFLVIWLSSCCTSSVPSCSYRNYVSYNRNYHSFISDFLLARRSRAIKWPSQCVFLVIFDKKSNLFRQKPCVAA